MSTVYITEYVTIAGASRSSAIPVPEEPPVAEQTVAITGGSLLSNPFNARTQYIRVQADAVCSIAIGVSPTASTSSRRIPANQVEYFGMPQSAGGSGFRMAVIQNT